MTFNVPPHMSSCFTSVHTLVSVLFLDSKKIQLSSFVANTRTDSNVGVVILFLPLFLL